VSGIPLPFWSLLPLAGSSHCNSTVLGHLEGITASCNQAQPLIELTAQQSTPAAQDVLSLVTPVLCSLFLVIQSDPDPGSPPRLGELWVTDPTPHSLHLSWTVLGGQFDSFVVQYRDKEGQPRVVPVEGPDRSVVISPLDPNRKYRFTLFGIANKKRYGPLTADGTTGE
jgi:hypothetical protein